MMSVMKKKTDDPWASYRQDRALCPLSVGDVRLCFPCGCSLIATGESPSTRSGGVYCRGAVLAVGGVVDGV